jgi:hypothetical protein
VGTDAVLLTLSVAFTAGLATPPVQAELSPVPGDGRWTSARRLATAVGLYVVSLIPGLWVALQLRPVSLAAISAAGIVAFPFLMVRVPVVRALARILAVLLIGVAVAAPVTALDRFDAMATTYSTVTNKVTNGTKKLAWDAVRWVHAVVRRVSPRWGRPVAAH